MAYNDFAEMPVWQLGDQIVAEVYKLTEMLPKREDYALCSQLRNAAVSITGNIAEGFGRGHVKDKINFYYYSRGSAHEVRSHLFSGKTAGYFNLEQIHSIPQKCLQVIEGLKKIIKGISS